jgi:hypothetical protein
LRRLRGESAIGGDRHGAPARHSAAGGIAIRQVRRADLRCRAEPQHHPRLDRRHARNSAAAREFAGEGKVKATVEIQKLEAINATLNQLRAGTVDGRVVVTM